MKILLRRLFKTENGISLNRYIMKQRMDKAKQYLDEGSSNLQQISQMVGFADPFYFSKCFKKEYGIAPSKYAANAEPDLAYKKGRNIDDWII